MWPAIAGNPVDVGTSGRYCDMRRRETFISVSAFSA